MKQIAAGIALVAMLAVMAGCPGGQNTADLEAQVQAQQGKIAELEGQVQQLTMERDSLMKVIADMGEEGGSKPPRTGGGSTGGTTPPPGKPPRTGR
jgi:hypothetical protein